ncbi:MAG: protein kinase [Planctomycetes bacterium]|nr:protein kinase [Planctomycetota bacterium]
MTTADSAIRDAVAPGLDDTMRQGAAEIAAALARSRQVAEPPAQVEGYTVLECLGEGAYGSVWLAREDNTGRRVAIKFYTHRRGLDWSLLNREVEKLAVLSTSRNIVRLVDVGWDSDPPHYIMEYLENGSLAGLLSEGPLPAHEAVRIARSVLAALVHAHGSGILHCDLKPANVLLDANYEPRLGDFGQSRLSHEQNPALGTLFYMAPEQADLHAVPDARWDVYALGAILYQMLTGEAPGRTPEIEQQIHEASSLPEKLATYRRVLRESPRPAGHCRVSGVDRRLAEIVDRCLEIEPSRRFPNAQAVLDALELRDRHRARRPMILLGIVGPALLLLAMTPIVANALRDAVVSARRNVTDRALESAALSARILARSLERELEDRTDELIRVSELAGAREAVRNSRGVPWPERKPLFAPLEEQKLLVGESDTSWFVTDRQGVQRWREPYNVNTMDKSYAHRDYFRGLNLEPLPANGPPAPIGNDEITSGQTRAGDATPSSGVPALADKPPVPPAAGDTPNPLADKPPVPPRQEVEPLPSHISEAFRSEATRQFMVAISVPIRDETRDGVLGVLARTTHLEKLLERYEQHISGRDGDQVSRVIALVDSRNWELLDHPWMTEENLRTTDVREQLRLEPATIAQLKRLGQLASAKQPLNGYERARGYRDPAGRVAAAYNDEWLAAFSPVGDTGWFTVVQERTSEAQQPVEEMRADMIRYGLLALLVSAGLVGLLWFFVSRALSDRELTHALAGRGGS